MPSSLSVASPMRSSNGAGSRLQLVDRQRVACARVPTPPSNATNHRAADGRLAGRRQRRGHRVADPRSDAGRRIGQRQVVDLVVAGLSVPARRVRSGRGIQRLRKLLIAPTGTAIQLGGQRGAQAASDRRTLRHAGGEQVAPVDREPHVAQLLEPLAGPGPRGRARRPAPRARAARRPPRRRSPTARPPPPTRAPASSARVAVATIASRSSASNARESRSPRSSAGGTPRAASATASRSGRASCRQQRECPPGERLVRQAEAGVQGTVEPQLARGRASPLTGSGSRASSLSSAPEP